MRNIVVLENIRSCYNVWNIIRTADVLWFDVILSWYTPSPYQNSRVSKTSLGAEYSIDILEFYNPTKTIDYLQKNNYSLIVAESFGWEKLSKFFDKKNLDRFCIIFGNEKSWVLEETIEKSDYLVWIPMIWKKESLNVWQSAAMFMREYYRFLT